MKNTVNTQDMINYIENTIKLADQCEGATAQRLVDNAVAMIRMVEELAGCKLNLTEEGKVVIG